MRLQIIQDSNGDAAGVFIPIKEWKQLKKEYKGLQALEKKQPSEKEQLLQELKQALTELKLAEQGKLKARPAKDLLNEL